MIDYDLEAFGEAMAVAGCAHALYSGTPVPATYTIGTDSYPVTVVRASGEFGLMLYVRQDRVRGPGLFEPNTRPVDPRSGDDDFDRFTRRADGRYRLAGKNYGTLTIGRRELHLDRSF